MNFRISKLGITLPAFFLAVLLSAGIHQRMQGQAMAGAALYMCRLVYDKHYLGQKSLTPWFKDCLDAAHSSRNRDTLLGNLQGSLRRIPGSHLQLYTPSEDQFVWTGTGQVNGLDLIGVDGRILIWKVHPKVQQQFPQLRRGLELISVDEKSILSKEGLDTRAGTYLFKDPSGNTLSVKLEAQELNTLEKPSLSQLPSGTGLLSIPSFRAAAFKENWSRVRAQIYPFKKLVIDLRGNAGGSFVALMQALSPFICQTESAGRVVSPQVVRGRDVDFPQATEGDPLLDLIGEVHAVNLRRLKEAECYKGQVVVLVDQRSTSVTEIFAAAIKSQKGYLVEGQTTGGEMLLAVWYDLEGFGKGYSVSIPEAIYEGLQNEEIEGAGVQPDIFLYYDLDAVRQGHDSWLQGL